jgi:hypothetical protein
VTSVIKDKQQCIEVVISAEKLCFRIAEASSYLDCFGTMKSCFLLPMSESAAALDSTSSYTLTQYFRTKSTAMFFSS